MKQSLWYNITSQSVGCVELEHDAMTESKPLFLPVVGKGEGGRGRGGKVRT